MEAVFALVVICMRGLYRGIVGDSTVELQDAPIRKVPKPYIFILDERLREAHVLKAAIPIGSQEGAEVRHGRQFFVEAGCLLAQPKEFVDIVEPLLNLAQQLKPSIGPLNVRSAERRVGKECVSTRRPRGSP